MDHGYTTVLFDATNSFGKSGGSLENISLTSHWQDLEDVLHWAKTEPWYEAPFILAGHSLGGFSILHLTQKYPDKVKAIAPLSTIISGKFRQEAWERFAPELYAEWKAAGFREEQNPFDQEHMAKIPWSHMEDCLRYDALANADKITCPALLIVGENDQSTPPDQHILLKEKLSGQTELIIVPDCGHSFKTPEKLLVIKKAMNKFLSSL